MPLSYKLNRCNFFIELFKQSKNIIVDHARVAIKTGEEFMDVGTVSEKYAKRIFYSFSDLTSTVDSLELVPTFFSIKKVPAFYLKRGISEIQYYKYHLENHYIKIISLIDFTSNLVNEVYRLGIPTRKCNVYAILENLNTKDTPTSAILKKFDIHFQNIKRMRNIVIHEGKLESEEIKSIDSNLISKEILGEEKILIDYFNSQKQTAIDNVINKFTQDNTDVCNFLIDLSATMTKPFTDNYKFLKSLES